MEQQFNVGDVVRLKSGGPEMTIADLSPFNTTRRRLAICSWVVDGKENEEAIHVTSLELVSRGEQKGTVPFAGAPMPNEAFRLMLMQVALKTNPDRFLETYADLLFFACYSMKRGSLAFASDRDIQALRERWYLAASP